MDSINSGRAFFSPLFHYIAGAHFSKSSARDWKFFLNPLPEHSPPSGFSWPRKRLSLQNTYLIYSLYIFVLNCSYMYHAIVQGHLKVSSKEHKFSWNYLQQIIFHLHSSITKYNVKTSVTSAAHRLGRSPSSTIVLHLLAPFSLTELLGF